jgi:hypothetical protein
VPVLDGLEVITQAEGDCLPPQVRHTRPAAVPGPTRDFEQARVRRIAIGHAQAVEGGDPLIVVE